MERVSVQTDNAPPAVGPYSQGITLGDLVFCAGQAAIHPTTGILVDGGIQQQTRRVMENLLAVLEAAGSDFDHVLKSTVYLMDMSTFKDMNEIYGSFFTGTPPARTTVGVKELPLGAIVEIEMIASKK